MGCVDYCNRSTALLTHLPIIQAFKKRTEKVENRVVEIKPSHPSPSYKVRENVREVSPAVMVVVVDDAVC